MSGMHNYIRRMICTVLLSGMCVFIGCSTHPISPFDPLSVKGTQEARELYLSVTQINNALTTFKGLGSVRFGNADRMQRFRAAWAGAAPERIRFQLLGPAGQPVVSLAGDGQWNYLLFHHNDRLIKRRASRSSLKKFIRIDMDVEDLVLLIRGRVPMTRKAAMVRTGNAPGKEIGLEVLNLRGSILQKVYFKHDNHDLERIEIFGPDEAMIFYAEYGGFRTVAGFRVPEQLTLRGKNDLRVEMDIHRYWVNSPVNYDMFMLRSEEPSE